MSHVQFGQSAGDFAGAFSESLQIDTYWKVGPMRHRRAIRSRAAREPEEYPPHRVTGKASPFSWLRLLSRHAGHRPALTGFIPSSPRWQSGDCN